MRKLEQMSDEILLYLARPGNAFTEELKRRGWDDDYLAIDAGNQ